MMIKCTKCGFENQMGAIFCRGCGEKINMNDLNPEALAEKKKEQEKAEGKGKHTVRNIVGVVILLLVLAVAAGIFVPTGLRPLAEIAEADKALQSAENKIAFIGAPRVVILPKDMLFPMEEINVLFEKRYLDAADPAGGAYLINNLQVEAAGEDLNVYLYTKLGGKLPVVFQITGMPKVGDESAPVAFEVKSAKMGHLPIPAQLIDKLIIPKYKPAVENEEIKLIFTRVETFAMADGKLKLNFKDLRKDLPAVEADGEAADKKAKKAAKKGKKPAKKK